MSSNCYYEYYNYLQYIKNSKVPPIYLNENGYLFASAPLDFCNNVMSLRVTSPIIIDHHSLALDLSANYKFTGTEFKVDSSNFYLPNIPLVSGESYMLMYDISTGKISYDLASSGGGIPYIVGGTNIDVQHGHTIPVVSLQITSPVDFSGQYLYDVSNIDFMNDISIKKDGIPYIYTNTTTNPGEIWINTNGAGLDTLHINAHYIDCLSGNIQNVGIIQDVESITGLQNLNVTQTISGDQIYASTGMYAPLISSLQNNQNLTIQQSGVGTLSLQSDNSSNSISIDNTGTINIKGSTINIGVPSSVINMLGTVNTVETTNVQIYDQLITLNKNGSTSTSYGSGFEIEASGSIVGFIKTDAVGSSYSVKVPSSSTVYKMLLIDTTSGNIDVSGSANIIGNFDISGNSSVSGNMHIGSSFDVSGNTILTGNTHVGGAFDVSGNAYVNGSAYVNGNTSITGNTHVGGAFDVSGNAYVNGNTSVTGNTHVGGAFDVSGNAYVNGSSYVSSNANITGNTHIGGAFDVSGTTTLTGTTTINGQSNFYNTASFNSTLKFTSLSNTNKTTLLNIDPLTDIVSYETHPTYTQPLSSNSSNVISIAQSSATTNGYLASGDWARFDTMLSNISANAPITFVNNVINLSNVDLSGTNGYLSSTQYQSLNNSIAASTGIAISQVYYVGMNGNDASGTGSIMSPYATIQKAIDQCTDTSKYYTIYVAPYAYTESPTLGASLSPRISIVGMTNNTNSKNITITGSFTIATSVVSGNETNNVIAFKNLTIQTPTVGSPAINLTGKGFSLFINNCNIALSGSNTASVINLSSTSSETRYYFDNVRLNNVAVTSTNHMVNLVAGQIWSITNSDFTNLNTGGSVIYSYDNAGQLLSIANSSFTNTSYGNVFTIQSNPSSCSLTNTTLIGYDTDASSALLVLGNGVAAGSGGSFSVMNSILYNTNASTSSNTYIYLNGGATLISSSNTFYSPNTGVTTFNPFGYKATKTNNIVRYSNSSYISGNVAGTNVVNYPSVSAGIIVIENLLNDTDNLTNFNNATIKFNSIPLTATDASLVTFNPTTKQIAYRSIPTANAGSNIDIVTSGGNPTISVAISSTLDMSNQGIIGISYERFANNINIQGPAGNEIIYTTGTSTNLLLNPSGGIVNTSGHNIDLSYASIVGISSENFTTNMNIQVNGVATPIIYTTGTATDLFLNPNGGVINTNAHNIDLVNGSIIGANTLAGFGGSHLTINGGSGNNHILFKTGNGANNATRMEIDTTSILAYLPLDMSNHYITNASYLNFGNSNGGISIQQNGIPRIYTSANNLIIDPSTNGSLQLGGAHTFDLCGGRITNATNVIGLTDVSLNIQYLGSTSNAALYLRSATNPANKKMVFDNSGIHVNGANGVFDISGLTSYLIVDASGNLNINGGSGNSGYNFSVAGQNGNVYVGGTMDISGATTIAPSAGSNKCIVDTTGTHISGGILDASGVLYKNTLSDASGNVYINGISQFTNEVDMCANNIKMNLPDGSEYYYYVTYDLNFDDTKKLGYKKNITASSPLMLDGNNNLTYDFTSNVTYNNATTQINSSSLIGLSSDIIDISGITAVNISGPTYLNGSITSAGSANNVWNGTNYFAGDVSVNNSNTFIRSNSVIGLSSDVIDLSGVTAVNISGPTYMNGSITSAGTANNVWNGTNYFAGDVSVNNSNTFIRSNSVIGLSSDIIDLSGVTAVNISGPTNMNGSITSASTASNIWNGTNTYNNTVTFNNPVLAYSTLGVGTATIPTYANVTIKSATNPYTNTESGSNHFQILTGQTNSTDMTLYMGCDTLNQISYIQSVLWGDSVKTLGLNLRGGDTRVGGNMIMHNGSTIYLSSSTNFSVGLKDSTHAYMGYGVSTGNARYTCDTVGNADVSGSGTFYVNNTGGMYVNGQNASTAPVIVNYSNGALNTSNSALDLVNSYSGGMSMMRFLPSNQSNYFWQIGSEPKGASIGGSFHVYDQSGIGVYLADGATSWSSSSDSRLKKNIQVMDVSNAYENILGLNPVIYHLLNDSSTAAYRHGFIAQDMMQLLPNIVSVNNDGYYGISYTEIIPSLVASIKMQAAIISALNSTLSNYTSIVNEQATTISSHESTIASHEERIGGLEVQVNELNTFMNQMKQMFNL